MTDVVKGLLGAALIWVTPLGAQQKDFIGAKSCRSCHPSQFARQSASGHARALYRAAAHPLAASFTTPQPLLRTPDFHFQFQMTRQGLSVRAHDGRYVTELPIEWAFGAGEHAVTFVSKVSGEFYLEHSFSYFSDTGSFDLTPRHDVLPAATLHQAMGQPIRTQGAGAAISNCFGCHSTGPVSVSKDGEVEVTETGVQCEVCHGPGSAHRSAATSGPPGLAAKLISKPSAKIAGDLNRFCGQCHRVGGDEGNFDWDSAWSLRHQPPYLTRSRCFQNSNGALSCLTCHDPHERVHRSDAAYYRSKCVSCHRVGEHSPANVCLARNDPDCTACHMPLVAAGAHMNFRNHWIGVYQPGAALKPSR